MFMEAILICLMSLPSLTKELLMVIFTQEWGNEGNIIIDNFENTKDIHSPNVNGVFFEGNVQVKNFNNKGTIIGATHASGVKIAQKNDKSVTIENFNNEGTIGSKDSVFGIMMHGSKESKPIITNFNNSGKLLGANKSVFIKMALLLISTIQASLTQNIMPLYFKQEVK